MRKVPYEDRLQRMLELRQMRRMTEPRSAIFSYYFKNPFMICSSASDSVNPKVISLIS